MSGLSINLLPKSRQLQLHYRAWYVSTLRVYFVAFLSFIFISASLFGVGFYVDFTRRSLEKEATELKVVANSKENADIKQQVKQINSRIADYNTLASGLPKWSKFLQAFAGVVPEGVQIQSLSVDLTSKKVQIQGFASTRELVIALHDLIAADAQNFQNIDYPLENVARPKDVSFHYTFTLNDSLLK